MLKKLILAILAILLAACAYIFFFSKDFTVDISEAHAQAALDTQLAKGPAGRFGVELNVTRAIIDFRDNDTAFISTDFSANALGYKGHVTGEFQTGVRLNSPYIYLDNIQPVTVDIQTDEETKSELSEIKNATRKFLERQRDNAKSEDGREFFDNVVGETDETFQNTIIKASYGFFEMIPIYDLNRAGYKGSIASLALKDVEFSESYATITLSPKQALIRILMMIGALLAVILFLCLNIFPETIMNKLFGKKRHFDT